MRFYFNDQNFDTVENVVVDIFNRFEGVDYWLRKGYFWMGSMKAWPEGFESFCRERGGI